MVTGNKQAKEAEAAEQRRRAHVASYEENARLWWESGRRYYIVSLSLGGTIAGFASQSQHQGVDVSGTLEGIEKVGWQLRDIGYVYQPLKERSHALSDSAHITGDIIGVYTFTRPNSALPPVP